MSSNIIDEAFVETFVKSQGGSGYSNALIPEWLEISEPDQTDGTVSASVLSSPKSPFTFDSAAMTWDTTKLADLIQVGVLVGAPKSAAELDMADPSSRSVWIRDRDTVVVQSGITLAGTDFTQDDVITELFALTGYTFGTGPLIRLPNSMAGLGDVHYSSVPTGILAGLGCSSSKYFQVVQVTLSDIIFDTRSVIYFCCKKPPVTGTVLSNVYVADPIRFTPRLP